MRSLFFICFVAISSLGAQDQPKMPPPTKPPDPNETHMTMPLFAPFFIEDAEHASTLTMVNELKLPVHATVMVRSMDGSAIGQKVVTFAPHSQQAVPIKDILNTGGLLQAMGSVEVMPDPSEVQSMAIGAQLSIVGTAQSPPAYFEEELLMPDPMMPAGYRAVAPSAAGSPLIALLNTSNAPQTLAVTCLETGNGTRRSYHLAASQVIIAPACREGNLPDVAAAMEELESAGDSDAFGHPVAIDVSNSTGKGTFAVWGIAPTSSAGAHATISLNFSNSAGMNSPSMIFAGVPVGITDLLNSEKFATDLAVANFGLKPATVTVSFSTISAGSPEAKTVATLNLPPGSVQPVQLPDLAGDPGLRNSFTITSNSQPGAVIANLISRGQRMYPAVQLIGKDAQDIDNGGGHPWSIANGNESTLLLFNHAAKPIVFNVNIAAEGTMWHQEYKLAPNETRALDVRTIVAKQAPDLHGKKLPVNATAGDASWFTADSGNGTGRLLVSNSQIGLARNFSCGQNLVLCGAYLDVASAIFGVTELGVLGSIEPSICTAWDPNSCYGQQYGSGGGGYSYAWQSMNTSIAPISGSNANPSASFYGNSPGIASANGSIYNNTCNMSSGGQNTVVNVQITLADVTQDSIWVVLSGDPSVSGILNVQVTGPDGQSPIDPITNETAGPGTYIFDFGLNNIPIGEYTTVTATWTVNGTPVSTTFGDHFKVMGAFLQTQYNTPAESDCGGSAQAVTVYNNSCNVIGGTMLSGFVNRVANPNYGTGSGHSQNYGDVKEEFFCATGSTVFRGFQTITGTLGPLNDSTVAVNTASELYQAGTRVFIVGEGVKTVTDACGRGCPDLTHLDNYSTNTCCNCLGSLPSALTIRLY